MRRSTLLLTVGLTLAGAGCSEDVSFAPQTTTATAGVLSVDGSDFVSEGQLFVHECDERGTGSGVLGDRIANFTFKNCLGDDVSLHDVCGRRKALWLVGSAGWCGACIAHFPEVVQRTRELRSQGLETLIFVSETENYEGVTEEWCQGFADEHGLDPARTIFQPGGPDGLQTLWNYVRPNGGGGGTIGLPWEVVLDPYDMTFFWDPSMGVSANPAIDELVSE